MRDLDDVFDRLQASPFRQRFRLQGPEREYMDRQGLEWALAHAADFIDKRLAPASPPTMANRRRCGNTPSSSPSMRPRRAAAAASRNGMAFPKDASCRPMRSNM